MRVSWALVFVAGILLSVVCGAQAAERPNIIFILADDLGYGDLGVYGQEVIKTPNLDRMAAEGMRFTDYYAGSAVCAPSRSCLMTGQHTGHTYMRGNGNHWLRPDSEDVTVARLLKDAGYATAMIGKSSTSGDVPDDLAQPNKKGFDHFYGVLGHGEAHHYYPEVMYRNGERIEMPGNHSHHGDQYCHDLYLAEAIDWIGEQQEGPFFLMYSALIPHASLSVPEEWVAKYRGKVGEERVVPEGHYAGTNEPKAVFAGMVSRLDWEVGQILDALKKYGIDDNTIVMFASDNGAHAAGGHLESDFNSSGPLRGEKRDVYEGGIRSPLLVRWPGTVAAGAVNDHVGAHWDFLATACALAGVAPPKNTDGISMLPTILGNDAAQQEHTYLYWEFFEKGGRRAVRMGDFKAVQNDVLKNPDGPIELYDVSKDLAETTDLAAAHPELVSRVRTIFETARTPSPIAAFNWERR
jgi:arylsulfatase A-like enzyme